MARRSGGKIVTDGLVLALDGADITSFRGEPTTNLVRNDRDFSGNAYANNNEYFTPTLNKTYESNISTPIGMGATLIEESGQSGYALLNRFGGGEIGNHSLSCYIYPISPITEFTQVTIGLSNDSSNTIYFNLNTNSISYGSGVINRNAFIETVPGWPGWYRIGGNHEGRNGGWIGSIGYGPVVQYTGTAGNKKMYITGIQYELTEKPTHFIGAGQTRGATVATGGGWADLSGNTNHGELVNGVGYDSGNGGSLTFDGVDDYVDFGSDIVFKSSGGWTVENWVNFDFIPTTYNNTTSPANFIGSETITHNSWYWSVLSSKLALWNRSPGVWKYGSTVLQAYNWYNVVLVCNDSGTSYQMYLNGIAEGGDHTTYTWNATYSGLNVRYIARGNSSNIRQLNGKIPITKIYNRALTADEVLQNFNATRGRFGI